MKADAAEKVAQETAAAVLKALAVADALKVAQAGTSRTSTSGTSAVPSGPSSIMSSALSIHPSPKGKDISKQHASVNLSKSPVVANVTKKPQRGRKDLTGVAGRQIFNDVKRRRVDWHTFVKLRMKLVHAANEEDIAQHRQQEDLSTPPSRSAASAR